MFTFYKAYSLNYSSSDIISIGICLIFHALHTMPLAQQCPTVYITVEKLSDFKQKDTNEYFQTMSLFLSLPLLSLPIPY